MRALRPLLVALAALAAACADPMAPLAPDARDAARKPPKPTPAPTRHPILFVHGWNSSGAIWSTMTSRLLQDGWTSAQLAVFSYNSAASNATTAGIIAQKVDSIRAVTGAAQVDLVTHSMGALSARHYVRFLGGDGKVDALVSLGGPNHGTNTAALCLQTACLEMRPGSSFLSTLNAEDESWGTPRYATWWTACDQVIQPQTSTILAGGATNTQTTCMSHSQLYTDSRVYAQLRDFVNASPTLLAVAP